MLFHYAYQISAMGHKAVPKFTGPPGHEENPYNARPVKQCTALQGQDGPLPPWWRGSSRGHPFGPQYRRV